MASGSLWRTNLASCTNGWVMTSAPRGNAVLDALRRLRPQPWRSEEDAERPGRHSHGGPWERVVAAPPTMSKIERSTHRPPAWFGSWVGIGGLGRFSRRVGTAHQSEVVVWSRIRRWAVPILPGRIGRTPHSPQEPHQDSRARTALLERLDGEDPIGRDRVHNLHPKSVREGNGFVNRRTRLIASSTHAEAGDFVSAVDTSS